MPILANKNIIQISLAAVLARALNSLLEEDQEIAACFLALYERREFPK